jgi:hypothetical protein
VNGFVVDIENAIAEFETEVVSVVVAIAFVADASALVVAKLFVFGNSESVAASSALLFTVPELMFVPLIVPVIVSATE